MSREFDYFDSPHVSKLVDLVLQLGTELHVATHRLRALEMTLVRSGVLERGQLDAFRPDTDEQQVLDTARDSMVERLMRIITEDGPAEHPLRDQWEAVLQRKAG